MTDDAVKEVARDMREVWHAFRRIEAVASCEPNPNGFLNDACLIAGLAESTADQDMDIVKFTRFMCLIRDTVDAAS